MYKIGDMLMHPAAGVCRIDDVKSMKLSSRGAREYYILKPVYGGDTTTIYIPVDCPKDNLRRLLSESDIYELIHSVSRTEPLWIDNDMQRKERFSQILRGGDRRLIIQLIAELHEKSEEREARGKKLHAADAKALAEAEKLIHEEFAYALKLAPDEVAPFIMKEMNLIKGA